MLPYRLPECSVAQCMAMHSRAAHLKTSSRALQQATTSTALTALRTIATRQQCIANVKAPQHNAAAHLKTSSRALQ